MPNDPLHEGLEESAPTPDPAGAEGEGELAPGRSPYKNLWAPLVVVPALIVMVLALVGLLFGSIAGKPRSAADYVDAIVSGGRNERKQALFGLSQRIVEAQQAQLEGGEPEFRSDRATLEPLLADAWERTEAGDHETRYVLAALMAQIGMEEGVPRLASMLDLTEAEDPDAKLRFDVLLNLGSLGDPRALPALERAATDPDKGLRTVAVTGMQKLPLESVRPALVAALGDDALQVRASAAVSLSKLGDPAGATVLRDATDPEVYAAEHALDPHRFAGEATISESRIKALEGLARLHRPQDRELVARLAAADADLNVRGAAKRALEAWGEGAPEGGN